MPDRVRERLTVHARVDDVVAAGLLRPGYTDNAGARSDGQRGEARSDNYTVEVVDDVATAVRTLAKRFMARRVILVGHSGARRLLRLYWGGIPMSPMPRCWCRVAVAGHEAFSRST